MRTRSRKRNMAGALFAGFHRRSYDLCRRFRRFVGRPEANGPGARAVEHNRHPVVAICAPRSLERRPPQWMSVSRPGGKARPLATEARRRSRKGEPLPPPHRLPATSSRFRRSAYLYDGTVLLRLHQRLPIGTIYVITSKLTAVQTARHWGRPLACRCRQSSALVALAIRLEYRVAARRRPATTGNGSPTRKASSSW